jgi:ATP-dependent HslUV protease ATP-binding subunit HslU
MNYTPKEIVTYLDKYIIGQKEAKKAVAIALRNRFRRKMLDKELQEEISPKNIIMIGPTGVGKTEIARRLAKFVKAPFVKVEATKFTEVGYVGRDVEQIIRDLVEISVRMIKQEKKEKVKDLAKKNAEERILELLLPRPNKASKVKNPFEMFLNPSYQDNKNNEDDENIKYYNEQKEILRRKLQRQELEDEIIEVEIEDNKTPMLEIFGASGNEEMGINIQDMLGGLIPKKNKKRKLPVKEAREIIIVQEADKLLDMDEVTSIAIERVEQEGIVFLDEIDKIAVKEGGHGPDVSRGGVQRDILPIVEGATVMSKYGPVKTDHILFIAAGAFHVSKPSDLIPELQGRFPIRVELENLKTDEFNQILTEPKNSLIKQYKALIETEGIEVEFTDDAVYMIAEIAFKVNSEMENIGARRLHTIMERLLQDFFFEIPEEINKILIDKNYVNEKLQNIVQDKDLSRYIL